MSCIWGNGIMNTILAVLGLIEGRPRKGVHSETSAGW